MCSVVRGEVRRAGRGEGTKLAGPETHRNRKMRYRSWVPSTTEHSDAARVFSHIRRTRTSSSNEVVDRTLASQDGSRSRWLQQPVRSFLGDGTIAAVHLRHVCHQAVRPETNLTESWIVRCAFTAGSGCHDALLCSNSRSDATSRHAQQNFVGHGEKRTSTRRRRETSTGEERMVMCSTEQSSSWCN